MHTRFTDGILRCLRRMRRVVRVGFMGLSALDGSCSGGTLGATNTTNKQTKDQNIRLAKRHAAKRERERTAVSACRQRRHACMLDGRRL